MAKIIKSKYIRRKAVYDALNTIGGCNATDEWSQGWDKAIDEAIKMVKDIPAADVAVVKHGGWNKSKAPERLTANGFVHDDEYICSCCGWSCCCAEKLDFNFCPNCGADMREHT